MNISPKERKELNAHLINMMERSQRSLVSLRKNDFSNLFLDMEKLAVSIAGFTAEMGVE